MITLAEQVAWRLRRHSLRGATLQLKIRFNDFQTITRSMKLRTPTNSTQEICDAASEVLTRALERQTRPVRLLGVGLSNLLDRPLRQTSLFDAAEDAAQQQVDEAADAIRAKFGGGSLKRASGIRKTK